jgi:hypothetical protein
MNPPASGYSGTPLAKKLGIIANAKVACFGEPPEYKTLLSPIPSGVAFGAKVTAETDIIHVFETNEAALSKTLARLRTKIRKDGAIWVSWPKKASKVPPDITEDTIRAVALPLGFVDIKVCAVSEVWSGLKLVIRKELR